MSSRDYYITCIGKTDGGGAQVLAVLSTLAYAQNAGITYVHTPFKKVSHNTEGDPNWHERWERAFSLGYGEKTIEELDLNALRSVPLTQPRRFLWIPRFAPTLLVARHCHWYANHHPESYEALRHRLREKYGQVAKTGPPINPEIFRVAVHVRRGDVNLASYPDRFTEDDVIARQLDQIEDTLRGVPYEVHLYSEGAEEELALFRGRAHLHLNEDVLETLDQMSRANLLVMARSSLSYVAALLSRGIMVYSSFRRPALSDWLISGPAGTIPQLELEQKLAHRSRS